MLGRIAFSPASETLRAYNVRFNNLAGSGPAGLIAQDDLVEYYLKGLARGDRRLMEDVVWTTAPGGGTLAQI